MKTSLAILTLFLVAPFASAQSIVVDCPSMPVIKQGIGRWQAQKIVSVAVVKLPPNGEVLNFADFTIQATMVRGIVRRSVDPCEITGLATEDGSVMTLDLPREPVVLRGFTPVALAMTARGTLIRPDGTWFNVTLNYPDCPTSRLGRGKRLAASLVATGTVSLP